MATKKEKRERALAKREAFLKEERERGLKALRLARDEQAKKDAKLKDAVMEENRRLSTILAAVIIGSGAHR